MSSTYPPAGSQSFRRCSHCGTPLPPNGAICGLCGAYTALPQASQGQTWQPQAQFQNQAPNQPPQWQPQSQTPSGPLWGNGGIPANPSQAAPWNQSAAAGNVSQPLPPGQPLRPFQPIQAAPTPHGPQLSSPSQFQPFSAPPGAGGFAPDNESFQRLQGMPGSFATSGAPVFSNTYASYDHYQVQEKGNIGLILTIGALVLLLVGGGLAALLYFNKPSAPPPPQTPVIKTPTIKPLFRDVFTNNNTGWLLSNNPGVSSQQVVGGKLTLEDDDNKLLWEILPGKTFSDFRLDVDATLTKGNVNNAYGVYIRGVSTATSDIGAYYRLEIYGDGTFAIFKGTQDSNGNTVNQQVHYSTNPVSAILTEGHSNHITIIAKGSSLTFMVNGVTIFNYTDTTYRSGLIALFVSNLTGLTGGAQATFANLAIFPASQG